MAGLYDGLEEVAFKRIAGGYLFQANNPYFFGPKQRFFVNETQKVQIAACPRETLKRIKPFVFVAMGLIPAIIVGAIFWFATRAGTLDVTVVDASGQISAYSQAIGPSGSTGTLPCVKDWSVVFHVSGKPAGATTVTLQGTDANGKAAAPCLVRFDPAAMTIEISDIKNRTLRTAKLVSQPRPTLTAITVFALLVTLGLFALYIAAIHVYSMSRLRPFLAGLPPSNERISMWEGVQRFAAKMSNKLLALMGLGAVMVFASNVFNLTSALLSNRSIENPIFTIGAVASVLLIGQVVGLTILKLRAAQNAV
jgi:hypothetical protein